MQQLNHNELNQINFDVKIYESKTKIKSIFITFGVLLLISLCCVFWALLNWEEHSILTKSILRGGRTIERGLAPTLFGWGIAAAVCIAFILIMYLTTIDFKNPVLAVSKDGLFINKQFYKKIFLQWEDFSTIELEGKESNTENIFLKFKSPEKITDLHKGVSKAFLKNQERFNVYKEEDPEIFNQLLKFLK